MIVPGEGAAAAVAPSQLAHPWESDVLGVGYAALTLDLEPDDEGSVVATLVRHQAPDPPPGEPNRAVLYLHGWSDYFYQIGLAEHWGAQGATFFALDLRKFGRSMRAHQTPGYVSHLEVYDEEIAAALAVVRAEVGADARLVLTGFSAGGLVAALWAHRHPGRVSAVALTSPWLELQGAALLRHLSGPAVSELARRHPKAALPNLDAGWSTRAIGAAEDGGQRVDPRWHPTPVFPVRAGWLRAVMAGQAQLAHGLSIDVPVLVLASARSHIGLRWDERMRSSDVVIDVEVVARRAVQLGPTVTVVRVEGGLHDLTLSPLPARARFYGALERWSTAYAWGAAARGGT